MIHDVNNQQGLINVQDKSQPSPVNNELIGPNSKKKLLQGDLIQQKFKMIHESFPLTRVDYFQLIIKCCAAD